MCVSVKVRLRLSEIEKVRVRVKLEALGKKKTIQKSFLNFFLSLYISPLPIHSILIVFAFRNPSSIYPSIHSLIINRQVHLSFGKVLSLMACGK